MFLICLNGCFGVSESMSITDRQTELLLEVPSDLKRIVASTGALGETNRQTDRQTE